MSPYSAQEIEGLVQHDVLDSLRSNFMQYLRCEDPLDTAKRMFERNTILWMCNIAVLLLAGVAIIKGSATGDISLQAWAVVGGFVGIGIIATLHVWYWFRDQRDQGYRAQQFLTYCSLIQRCRSMQEFEYAGAEPNLNSWKVRAQRECGRLIVEYRRAACGRAQQQAKHELERFHRAAHVLGLIPESLEELLDDPPPFRECVSA